MKKTIISLLIFTLILSVGCTKSIDDTDVVNENNDEVEKEALNKPKATIIVNNEEKIVIELDPNVAPNTVNNFISLAEDGFYDGLIFHRVIKDFMIQGGCPKGDGTGDPGYSIKGEFSENGFENNLSHERGVISMARAQDPNSAGSQFFIMHKDSLFLDGKYASFGKVIEGIDIVDKIAEVKTDKRDKPLEEQFIKSVTVDLNGYEFVDPKIIE